MKVLFINEVCGHTSTGKICAELAEKYETDGHEVKIAYGRDNYVPEKYQKYAVRIGTDWDVKLHAILTRITDKHGLGSQVATKKFLKWAEEYNPDLVWLHNLHGYYINYEMLFEWIKSKPDLEVKWTLHDCWAFTGHCTHFAAVKCSKWKNHCNNCPQLKYYPRSLLKDSSFNNFTRKKRAFTGVKKLTVITPSKWLAEIVKQSFLGEYPIELHYNKISTDVFKPTPSDFREKYSIGNKIIILGVANVWNERKGLYYFYKLAQMLDNKYVIVLVGLTEKQIRNLPKNIIGIKRVDNQTQLAGIYTAANVLVNPSVEESFGMTPLEAKACGTKSVVFQDTACEELALGSGNKVVPQNVSALYEAITGKRYEGVSVY